MNKTGALIINLGTPDTPTYAGVRRYLAEFLHDQRIIDLTRWLWLPILHGIILTFRPLHVAKAYRRIWQEDSPLRTITQQQAKKLTQHCNLPVEAGMCYGTPSIDQAMKALTKQNVEKIIILPLYPQYSATTTAAAFDKLAKTLKTWPNVPDIIFNKHYHDHPLYIKALTQTVKNHWQKHGQSNKLLISFHGIPQDYANKGDPYPEYCHQTAQKLAKELQLSEDQWQLGYQSRLGPKAWLQPYSDNLLTQWAKQGIETVDIICPGFAADCLETLDEIQREYTEKYKAAGGKELRYIPALNTNTEHIDLLAALINNYT